MQWRLLFQVDVRKKTTQKLLVRPYVECWCETKKQTYEKLGIMFKLLKQKKKFIFSHVPRVVIYESYVKWENIILVSLSIFSDKNMFWQSLVYFRNKKTPDMWMKIKANRIKMSNFPSIRSLTHVSVCVVCVQRSSNQNQSQFKSKIH